MPPLMADVLNAVLGVLAAFFIGVSIHKLYRDKKVRGIAWSQVAFFTALSFWNAVFYYSVDAHMSFQASLLVAAVATLYLVMLLYYTWQEEKISPYHDVRSESMFIETYTGKKFYVLDPDPDAVELDDIAHALGNICRYMGHTTRFYSVAEHCCLMSDWCMEEGWGPEKAFAALIHDSGEPYSGDQPRPWKAAVPILKELEQQIDDVVLPAIGGGATKPKWLEEIDARIIMDERLQARIPSSNTWMTDNLKPLGVTLKFWTPVEASHQWLLRYNELSASMGVPHGEA